MTQPPQDPQDSPSTEPRLSSPLPSWKRPTPDPVTTPPPGSLASDPSPETGWDGGSDADAGSLGLNDEPPAMPSPKSGRSRTSSRGAASKASIRQAIASAIETVTGVAHQRFTDDAGEAAGLFLADADDVRDISTPAAELVHRRTGALPVSDDLGDGIALGIALAAYVAKQVNRWGLVRRQRREAEAAWTAQGGYDTPDDFAGEPGPDETPVAPEDSEEPGPASLGPRASLPDLADLRDRL